MATENKGIIYYKLDPDYHFSGDYTKNCGLNGGEIDGNFQFLRGYDISSFDMSEDKEGYVAFGLKYDADLGTDILEMYIIDHTSHSFLPEVVDVPYDWGGYSPEKPTADMAGQWIGATFKRVN